MSLRLLGLAYFRNTTLSWLCQGLPAIWEVMDHRMAQVWEQALQLLRLHLGAQTGMVARG